MEKAIALCTGLEMRGAYALATASLTLHVFLDRLPESDH